MKKQITWLLIAAVCICALQGCSFDLGGLLQQEAEPTPPVSAVSATDGKSHQSEAENDAFAESDTYWVAQSYCEEGQTKPTVMDAASWSLDLLIRVDGTACFRDVHDGWFLMEDADQYLVWEGSADGTLTFYNSVYAQPTLQAKLAGDVLEVDYRGITLTMKQQPLPKAAGELYCPAQLVGTWVMVTGETEGMPWECMPGTMDSIVFRTVSTASAVVLEADLQWLEADGTQMYASRGCQLKLQSEALYDGCENEAWCVQIVDEASSMDIYATMISYDVLMVQRYYTLDEAPAVSTQFYWRMPHGLTWWDVEESELIDTHWICTGYTDETGQQIAPVDNIDHLEIDLCANGVCLVRDNTKAEHMTGTWQLAGGGTIILRGEEDGIFWYGGAVRGYCIETDEGIITTYDMDLYYQGGIAHMTFGGYG